MTKPIGKIIKSLNSKDIDILPATPKIKFSGNPFEDVLSKAIGALNTVSKTEVYANQMIQKYAAGEAEMSDVMIAASKMNIMVQLAVTVVNNAVTTFKEVTQMQI